MPSRSFRRADIIMDRVLVFAGFWRDATLAVSGITTLYAWSCPVSDSRAREENRLSSSSRSPASEQKRR